MKGFVVAGRKTDALACMHVSSLFSPTNSEDDESDKGQERGMVQCVLCVARTRAARSLLVPGRISGSLSLLEKHEE